MSYALFLFELARSRKFLHLIASRFMFNFNIMLFAYMIWTFGQFLYTPLNDVCSCYLFYTVKVSWSTLDQLTRKVKVHSILNYIHIYTNLCFILSRNELVTCANILYFSRLCSQTKKFKCYKRMETMFHKKEMYHWIIVHCSLHLAFRKKVVANPTRNKNQTNQFGNLSSSHKTF